MKKLILVRHAKSSWDFPDLDDFDRPLNQRGERDAPQMAERLLQNSIVPDVMITSGARRAFETAKVFSNKLCVAHVQVNNKLFHASSAALFQIVRALPEATKSIMIFGHNPGLTDFANAIGEIETDNISTCGIYGILWPATWKEIGSLKASTFIYDYPKKK